jgi:hypothetical protein
MTQPDLEILIDTPAVRLVYHFKHKVVHHELRRFVYGQPLRDVLEQGATLVEKRGAKRWLSDDRGNGPLKPADAEWCQTVWFPRVTAAGWRHWAVVMPDGVVGQMNMRRWIEVYAALGINAHPFDEPDQAMSWLTSQQD